MINGDIMTVSQCIFCVAIAALAGCYGWGMRGTIIGGEKGAMLPGLLIALTLSMFSGDALSQYYWIPAAAGLVGMTFGGIEPYGDTISYVIDPPPAVHNLKKGVAGLALKGAVWFGVFGGIVGKAFSAMAGKYSVKHIVLFCLACPVFQFIGYRIFNTPVDLTINKMPKTSFSYESREEWGSNVGIIVALIVSGIIVKDILSLVLLLFGIVFGAIGWVIAIFMFYRAEVPMKNGKILFGNLRECVGGWKLMEFTLGLIGGAGIALGFVLCRSIVVQLNNAVAVNGLFSPLKNSEIAVTVVMGVLFVCLLLINIYEYVCDEKGKKLNNFVMDCIERPFFNLLPLVFILLCSLPAARLMSVFMLIYACTIKISFDRFKKGDHRTAVLIIYFSLSASLFVVDLFIGGFSPFILVFTGGIPYLLTELLFIMWHRKQKAKDYLLNLKHSGQWWVMFALNIALNVAAALAF